VDELVALYRNEGQRIFPQKSNVLVNTLVHAMQHKYDAAHLEAVLEEKLGSACLQDAMTNVLVTSYDIERREPHLFIRRPSIPGARPAEDFAVRDVARATSAAPTYFEPAYLEPTPPNGKRYALIDGGVFANNPALLAYIEAKRVFPNATRFVILSLGTGIVVKPYRYAEVKDWGYIDWMAAFRGLPLFSMMMDGQSDVAVSVLRDFPGVKLVRLDPHIDEKHAFMDDAGPDNIAYLERRAMDLIEQSSDQLDELCHRL
jgi:patatin-like phospholipase/acyl hydrolase